MPWRAPEVHLDRASRSKQSDMYSFGLLCLAVGKHQNPFAHLDRTNQIKQVVTSGDFRPELPEELLATTFGKRLQCAMSSCVELSPSSRKSAFETLELLE